MPRWAGGVITIDDGTIKNNHIGTTEIDADKLQHIHKAGTCFALAIGGTPATREEIVYVASAAGTVRLFSCVLNDSGTSTSITFDLKKNGTTMLSGAVSYVHGDGDKTVKDGTLSVTAVVAGDILSIAMTVSSATGAQGPFAWCEVEETAGV